MRLCLASDTVVSFRLSSVQNTCFAISHTFSVSQEAAKSQPKAVATETHSRPKKRKFGELTSQELDPFRRRISDFVADLSPRFVGRAWLAKRVCQELAKADNAMPARLPTWVVIYGDSGTGKTAFLRRVLDKEACTKLGAPWQPLHDRVLARHECSVYDPDSLDPKKWARALVGQLIQAVQEQPRASSTVVLEDILFGHADVRAVMKWVEKSTIDTIMTEWVIPALEKFGGPLGKMRDIIILDSLDEGLTYTVTRGAQRRSIVSLLSKYTRRLSGAAGRKLLPGWVRLVATSRPDETTRHKLHPLLEDASIKVDNEENRQDVQEFVQNQIDKINPKDPAEKVRQICAKAQGVFMYAAEAINQLKDNPKMDLEALPAGIAALYMQRYLSTFPQDTSDQWDAHTKPMLAMLLAAREPLPMSMVESADRPLDCNSKWRWARDEHLEFVYRWCVGRLLRSTQPEMQLSHKSLSDWLTSAKNKRFAVKIVDGHVLLARVCASILRGSGEHTLVKDGSVQMTPPSDEALSKDLSVRYAVKHWAQHLCKQGRVVDAGKLVCSFEWILARVLCDENTTGVVQDGVDVAAELPHGGQYQELRKSVDLVVSMARLATKAVEEDPRQILGQMVGRLMWYTDGKGDKLRPIVALVGAARACQRWACSHRCLCSYLPLPLTVHEHHQTQCGPQCGAHTCNRRPHWGTAYPTLCSGVH